MTIQHFAYSTYPNGDCGVLTISTFTPLTLRGCTVDAEVRGNCARVNVRYEYVNYSGSDQRVIAVYPMPIAWDLMYCRADYAGDYVASEYTTAVPLRSDTPVDAASAAPALPGPRSDNSIFTVASQCLPWVVGIGESILIAAMYHVPLNTMRNNGVVCVQFPAELFPGAKAPLPSTLTYASLFDIKLPPKLFDGWAINLRCDMFLPLAGTVRHFPSALKGEVEYIGDSAFTLRCTAPLTTRLREGFEMVCVVRETVEPLRFFLAKDEGSCVDDLDRHAMVVTFTPQLYGRHGCMANTELVLLVDSHSNGTSAAIAYSILVAVRGVPESALLNVIVIGMKDDMCLCPKGAESVKDLQLDQIVKFVAEARPQTAATGVSRLHRALHLVMSQNPLSQCGPVPTGYVRHIVVISDEGDTLHATDIIRSAACHRHKMRFSAIGLLSAGTVDVPMLQLLAKEGGGMYHNAEDAQQLTEVLVHILQAAVVPTLTDITISVENPEVRLSTGETIPAVAQGEQYFVYGFVPSSISTVGVCATGRIGSRVIEYLGSGVVQNSLFLTTTEPGDPSSISLFHLAAASARVRYLVDTREVSVLTTEEMCEVARISRTFMQPSPLTEMVQWSPAKAASMTTPTLTAPTLVAVRYVPRSSTFSRMLMQYRLAGLVSGSLDHTPKVQPRREEEEEGQRQQQQQQGVLSTEKALVKVHVAHPTLLPTPPCSVFIRDIVENIVVSVMMKPNPLRLSALQAADGSFPLSATLCTCVGIPLEQLERDVPLQGFGISEDLTAAKEYLNSHEHVWATAVVAAGLEKCSQSGTMALVYNKALAYLSVNDAGGELLRHAQNIFSNLPLLSS